MKKSIIFILLTVLILGVFTACNGDVFADLFNGDTKVTITFKANGGTGDDKTQEVEKDVETALDANSFTSPDENYVFAGWTTDAAGEKAYYGDEESVTLTEDLTLYAQWGSPLDSVPTTTWEDGKYTLENDVSISSERINVEGNVKLFIPNGKTLTASKGITVTGTNSLTIKGNGSLIAGGTATPSYAAGIGGGNVGDDGGTVTIEGGTVTAKGGLGGAGIGGGFEGDGGTVTINGGIVTANGGSGGAGIGGGDEGDSGTVTITGGTVTINGGTVTATGGKFAAGIGGGESGDGGEVTINGGTVTANGGEKAAGIGGGNVGDDGGTVTINGGTVNANGGASGAGIGGGYSGMGGEVTINGGTVTATGGSGSGYYGPGAGIGAGDYISSLSHGTLTIGTGVAMQVKDSEEASWESYVVDVRHRYMKADKVN